MLLGGNELENDDLKGVVGVDVGLIGGEGEVLGVGALDVGVLNIGILNVGVHDDGVLPPW